MMHHFRSCCKKTQVPDREQESGLNSEKNWGGEGYHYYNDHPHGTKNE